MVNSNANAIGIIFPNSYDNLVPELAGDRLMASIPFAGRYRIIDFLLSSLANCGISNIAIVVRENYHSLMDHLGSGKDWDLARHSGGLHSARVMRRHEARSSSKVAASCRTVSRSRMKAVTSRLSSRLR